MRFRHQKPALLSLVVVLATVWLTAGDGTAPQRASQPLRVLAGSELADMRPVLEEAARATGVSVELDFTPTLDGARRVVSGEAGTTHDAVWFATDNYVRMLADGPVRTDASTAIMSSPVILGLRRPAAERITSPVSWASIAQAAVDRKLTFGMSDPARSHSATSALVGIATATADTGAALLRRDIPQATPRLRALFHAQTLSAPTTEDLVDAYTEDQTVDGVIAYESELLALNASGRLPEPLTLVYPTDGVVTATYPLTLLASASDEAKDAYTRLVDHLLTPHAQEQIRQTTFRRPSGSGSSLQDLPFPATFDVIDDLIAAYNGTSHRPARTLYVLDVSGSMAGERLDALRRALNTLTSGSLVADEQITLIPFSTSPGAPATFDLSAAQPQLARSQVQSFADGLTAQGDTAIYDALAVACRLLGPADANRITTIVLLTDGENNHGGQTLASFLALHRSLPSAPPVLPILFGEANAAEMTQLADRTGGHTFDGRDTSLTDVFARIRSSR